MTVEWTATGETEPRIIDASDWPGSETLRKQVLAAFHVKTQSGAWGSDQTVTPNVEKARMLLGALEAAGVTCFSQVRHTVIEDVLQTLGTARDWRETTAAGFERSLRSWMGLIPVLPSTTRSSLRWSKQLHATLDSGSRDFLTREQFDELQAAAQQVVESAVERIERYYEMALAGADLGSWRDCNPRSPERLQAALHGLLTGGEAMHPSRWRDYASMRVKAVGGCSHLNWLAPSPTEALAMVTLVMCAEGWNMSDIGSLRIASRAAGAGDEADYLTMSTSKPRRGPSRAHYTALFESGTEASSAHWVSLITRATHPIREHVRLQGVVDDHLILYSGAVGNPGAEADRRRVLGSVSWGVPDANTTRKRASWVPDSVGRLDFQMLHRTFETVINVGSVNNTLNTFFNDYMRNNPEVMKEARRIHAQGAQMGFDASAERFHLGITPIADASPKVLSGKSDTATVACEDITHNPITGAPCTESFMACLACPNAVVTPRHVPRLAYLWQALEDRRSAFTARVWESYRPHYLRLDDFLRTEVRLDEEGIKRTARTASQDDKSEVRRLLKGEYDA
ncbi:hypothetical protein QQX13_12200 [Demequina sp. SYSU T00068]|uniref:hypothetical protein n=1 Tax=Demequina lignilytica TaxID=3051663 RepID=UPI0026212D03|nr:hypothetical protein [Demequina sp. SYSU T00068]MDN4491596.1 hypothetical protein [Demequina sp. SYSU T00068]